MKIIRVKTGFSFCLRPVSINDAQFIIDVRLADTDRNKYIHKISPDCKQQEEWISNYLQRENDYYYVIENLFTGEQEGLIGLYNFQQKNSSAEWGRWVIKKGSLAAIESVDLIYQIAFDDLNLDSIFCRTLSENKAVVSFHDSILEKRASFNETMDVDGIDVQVIRHFVDKDYYYNKFKENIEKYSLKFFNRCLKYFLGHFEFHHIGVATKDIDKEIYFFSLLGYKSEYTKFNDIEQGITGQFIISDQKAPRLELLQALDNSRTLSVFLSKGIKFYHFGYLVRNFDLALSFFKKQHCLIVREPRISAFFKKRIVFIMLKNKFIIELIEDC